MNTNKQDEELKYFKAGCLSFCLKYYNCEDFDVMLIKYVDGYKLDKLSKNRQNEASAFLKGVMDTLKEVKYRTNYE